MLHVKVIERKTPLGFETLLLVDGAIGRAEEMLCLESPDLERSPEPVLTIHLVSAEFASSNGRR